MPTDGGFCPHCGERSSGEDRFCRACGGSLTPGGKDAPDETVGQQPSAGNRADSSIAAASAPDAQDPDSVSRRSRRRLGVLVVGVLLVAAVVAVALVVGTKGTHSSARIVAALRALHGSNGDATFPQLEGASQIGCIFSGEHRGRPAFTCRWRSATGASVKGEWEFFDGRLARLSAGGSLGHPPASNGEATANVDAAVAGRAATGSESCQRVKYLQIGATRISSSNTYSCLLLNAAGNPLSNPNGGSFYEVWRWNADGSLAAETLDFQEHEEVTVASRCRGFDAGSLRITSLSVQESTCRIGTKVVSDFEAGAGTPEGEEMRVDGWQCEGFGDGAFCSEANAAVNAKYQTSAAPVPGVACVGTFENGFWSNVHAVSMTCAQALPVVQQFVLDEEQSGSVTQSVDGFACAQDVKLSRARQIETQKCQLLPNGSEEIFFQGSS